MEKFSFTTIVKGVKFYNGLPFVKKNQDIVCEAEPQNIHDRNAVAVFAVVRQVRIMTGHLQRSAAGIIGPYLQCGRVRVSGLDFFAHAA